MRTILIISQVYVPDPAAVGQYMHEAAVELAQRGFRVIVYASARGYDDPSRRYPAREKINGVAIRRLPLSSFGKSSIKIRLLAQSLFLIQVMFRGVFTRGLDRVLVSTSPPMASAAALFLRFARRAPIFFWAMDINPDQIVAMGQLRADSLPARLFNWLNVQVLRRARGVVALDRYMAARLESKTPIGDRMVVVPPWPLESRLESIEHDENPFRLAHDLENKFVVMYSGNITPAHPVTTILDAAVRLRDHPRIRFLFIGGGTGKKAVEDFGAAQGLTNLRTLPYQPLEEIRYSLSAADVHLVSMGPDMVGIVHPCKVYSAMMVARPVLLLGPADCHVGELLARRQCGWRVDHGDVPGAETLLSTLADMTAEEFRAYGDRAHVAMTLAFRRQTLCDEFCDFIGKDAG